MGGVLIIGDLRDNRPLILIWGADGLGGTIRGFSTVEGAELLGPFISWASDMKLSIRLFSCVFSAVS